MSRWQRIAAWWGKVENQKNVARFTGQVNPIPPKGDSLVTEAKHLACMPKRVRPLLKLKRFKIFI